jgi:ribosomal protein L24
MMEKIRKGDEVVVITGKDKGKRGTVVRRVDKPKLMVSIFDSSKDVITRRAGFSSDNCLLRTYHTIKQRTFSNIRLTDNCYRREFRRHS